MMKSIVKKAVFLASLMSLGMSTQAMAASETYTIDPHHTYVGWHINHFGFSNPSGKWYADGTLVLDEAKPQDSTVDITIHVANVVTGIPELDEHLRSKAFFDTAQFPLATFKSTKVIVTGKTTAKVQGMLSLHGVTKPITLDVKMNKIAVNPISNLQTAGFSARSKLLRSDFDMNTLVPDLGDEITLEIEVEANLASGKAAAPAAPAPASSKASDKPAHTS